MLFDMAVKNIFRNKRRSILTMLVIFLAAFIVGIAQGWVNGVLSVYMDNMIRYQTGLHRITTSEYASLERFMPPDELLDKPDALISDLRKRYPELTCEKRINFALLLSHGNKTEAALGTGVDISESILPFEKRMLRGTHTGDGIVMGEKLAKKMGVRLGDRLLVATRTAQGGLNGIKLPVTGIYRFRINVYDEKRFFMPIGEAERLLKADGRVSEIYVYGENGKDVEKQAEAIQAMLPDGVVSRSFIEQLGPMYSMFETGRIAYAVIEALIMFLASFAIINTLMMALFERMREIGMLRSVGMTQRQLFLLFCIEGGLLGVVGGTAGAVAGSIVMWILSITGINFESAMQAVDWPVDYIIYPEMSIYYPIVAVIISVVVPVLASMLPAHAVRKYTPADALQK